MTKTNRLTNEELTEIRNRAEKATEGEWRVEESRYGGEYNVRTTVGFGELTACLSAKSDADFIAKSREDIPKLLAEIEQLRYALETIANSDGWLIDPEPLCGSIDEAYDMCVKTAEEAILDGGK